MGPTLTRRKMVCTTAAALAAPTITRAAIPSDQAGQSAGAAESGLLRFGFIGVGGRGTYLLRLLLQIPDVRVTAICDINEANLNRALNMVTDKGGPKPAAFSKGPTDYRRLCALDTVDAVVIATPVPLHAPMAVDAMRAGKHAFSEVAAATTLEDCWALVETKEKTGRTYMMAENSCYMRPSMQILTMVQRGIFGECTYAECGYVHDCRNIKFNADGTLTWRGEMARDLTGNLYPTHQFGPVAQWLGINRTDRL
ncbi:MAG: Gfo/Idh/MocA family oxidoreductase, partial [Candidatus Sumerlaeia bacterium]|nr:Gfo/Idh/MocA family oxidoreductase [Candidatus Sumerlaeia bacterium]